MTDEPSIMKVVGNLVGRVEKLEEQTQRCLSRTNDLNKDIMALKKDLKKEGIRVGVME